ncbi:unnamed protein product [Rotaria magnacalcarata]
MSTNRRQQSKRKDKRPFQKKNDEIKRTFHAKIGSIKDKQGRDLMEKEDIKKRWREYTEELYKKDTQSIDVNDGSTIELEPDILESEIKWALECKANNKAPGIDEIPAELFKILGDDAVKILLAICQQIWKTQQWPKDWKRSIYIPIPKKGSAKECSNYRTIALISHASKIMLKILQARLEQYMARELPDVQAGFRRGRGTRDHIANIRWIMEKAREFQKDIYICFIDYTKAFDCADHNTLWTVLNDMGVPKHLICLLKNLYTDQEATVRTEYGLTEWFKNEKGVRQGCILSPCLFNLYVEYIMRNAEIDETEAAIKISGRNINNLRYADDTTLMAENEDDLKTLLMKVKEESAKAGLLLNIKKTKIMSTEWMTIHNILLWQQSGARTNQSTISRVNHLLEQLTSSLRYNTFTSVLFIDFKQAFDMLWQQGLLLNLNRLMCPTPYLLWITNYFKDRTMTIDLNGLLSYNITIERGAPQGSVFGAIAYIVAHHDLQQIFERPENNHLYVDDLGSIYDPNIYFKFQQQNIDIEHRMNKDLEKLHNYTKQWHQSINGNKNSGCSIHAYCQTS